MSDALNKAVLEIECEIHNAIQEEGHPSFGDIIRRKLADWKPPAEPKPRVRRNEAQSVTLITVDVTIEGRTHSLTLEAARKLHHQLRNAINPSLTDRIKDEVSKAFDISVNSLLSKARPDKLCVARWFCFQLCREAGFTLEAIAELFGGRDHATVSHGLESLKIRMESKKGLRAELELIRSRVFTENKPLV